MLLHGDFNGVFGNILCLSHESTCKNVDGVAVVLEAGMKASAFDDDSSDGEVQFLVATGVVDAAPPWLSCRGSRWILRIDERGMRYEPKLPDEDTEESSAQPY